MKGILGGTLVGFVIGLIFIGAMVAGHKIPIQAGSKDYAGPYNYVIINAKDFVDLHKQAEEKEKATGSLDIAIKMGGFGGYPLIKGRMTESGAQPQVSK